MKMHRSHTQPITSREGSSTLVSVPRYLSRAFYQFLTLIYLYTVDWFPFFRFLQFSARQERFSSSNHKSLFSGLVHNWPDKFANGVFTLHRRIFRFVIEAGQGNHSYRDIMVFKKLFFKMFFLSTQKRNAETGFSYFSNTTILVFFIVYFYLFGVFLSC